MNLKAILEYMRDNVDDCQGADECEFNKEVLGLNSCVGLTCTNCRKQVFAKALELLERNYIEKEPDTLEKIEQDARKRQQDYWKCGGANCAECPIKIGEESVKEYYKAANCAVAQRLDLLRRQRELLEGEQCKN